MARRDILNSLVRYLVSAVANAALYSLDHQQVVRQGTEAFHRLEEALVEEPELVLLVIEEELVSDGEPLDGSLYLSRFVQLLRERGVGHLKFVSGVTRDELMSLVSSLAKQGGAGRELRSTTHIRLGRVEVNYAGDKSEDFAELRRRIPTLEEISNEELTRFLEMYEAVKQRKKLSITGISEIVSGFISSFHDVSGALLTLAPLRALDEYTFTHSTNVCVLNLAQAMALGIDGSLLHDIGIAAMLHDIGKLYIPEEIITKTSKLDDAEWEQMKRHPVKGAQHLLDTTGVPRLAVVTAFEHHLKYDLSGYPRVHAGWQQNLCSHMTTISDVFDAMRTKRSYRDPMEFARIVGIMGEMAGTELHPVLTRNFLRLLSGTNQVSV